MPDISPVSRSKQAAQKNYSRMSRWYDLLAGSSEKKFRRAGIAYLSPKQGEQILEIGFGTGDGVVELARAIGTEGRVHGLDISIGMQQVANRKIQAAGLSEMTNLRLGDGAKLPYENCSFDAVFMSFVLELFDTPEIPLVLQECWRVLKNGSRLVVVALVKEASDNLPVRLYEWVHRHMPTLVDCRPIYAIDSILQASFHIGKMERMRMWGLPVDVILAFKP